MVGVESVWDNIHHMDLQLFLGNVASIVPQGIELNHSLKR